jgi:hypothetical protein
VLKTCSVRKDFWRSKFQLQKEAVIPEESCFISSTALLRKRIITKITFVVDPLGSVPEGTTTKLIFITMGAQTGMIIVPE